MGLEEMTENGDALHQANIEIDEEGTVAAAATYTRVYKTASWTYFNFNRPFMFLIYDKKSKDVLFAGVYRGPINNDN